MVRRICYCPATGQVLAYLKIIDRYRLCYCFHFIEQPKGRVSLTSGNRPARIASNAFLRSRVFTADGSFQLSSILPLYCRVLFLPKTKVCGVQMASIRLGSVLRLIANVWEVELFLLRSP